ncbi:Xab2, partial [Symbiodinium sp. KB8]
IHPDQLDAQAQEIEAGYLIGPFSSVEEVTRYGLHCGTLLRFIARVLLNKNKADVVVPLSDGQVLRGAWSCEMRHSPPLLAKTFDLKKAYKQVATKPSSWRHAVLGYPDKKDGWTFAVSRSLPFGATSSVYAFNKLALAVLHIMVVKFHAIVTDFYDDYTVFEFQPAASLLDKVLCRLLRILGWIFAEDGKKFVSFGPRVVTLRVALHLEEIWDGRITIANKPGRIDKICSMLSPIAEGKTATRSQHGLLNFAGGHVLGFQLKLAVRMFSKALSRGRAWGVELRSAALLALDVLKGARLRVLLARMTPPMILYTDGAYENGVATWGAILLDRLSGARWMFHGTVCRALCDRWRAHAGERWRLSRLRSSSTA